MCNFTHPGHNGCKFYSTLYYSGGARYDIKYIITGAPRVTGCTCKALPPGCQLVQKLEHGPNLQISLRFSSGFRGKHETRIRSALKVSPLFYLPRRRKLNFAVLCFSVLCSFLWGTKRKLAFLSYHIVQLWAWLKYF